MAFAMPAPGTTEFTREAPFMDPDRRNHPTNLDEADRHALQRRMPTIVAIVLALAIVALLAYVRMR
jgi:hypothetical protein